MGKKSSEEIGSILHGLFAGADLTGAQIIAYNDGEVNYIKTGKEKTETTLSEDRITDAIRNILNQRDEKGNLVLTHNYQWFAIKRVLSVYANFPSQATTFVNKMNNLGFTDGDKLTYSSLVKASESTPLLAKSAPETWDSYKDKSDQYEAQFIVADLLMKELGIKA